MENNLQLQQYLVSSNITEQEVIDATRSGLELFKSKFNEIVDQSIVTKSTNVENNKQKSFTWGGKNGK